MKKIMLLACMCLLLLAPLACQKTYSLGPNTSPTATPTLTPNLTPVCGITSVTLPLSGISLSGFASLPQTNPPIGSPFHVIRNLTQWQAFCALAGPQFNFGTPTPTPTPSVPVDFNTQMLIVNVIPICAYSTLSVADVCEGNGQVVVSLNNTSSCFSCNLASPYGFPIAVAVPQSNLPVTWAITNIPCSWSYLNTPTPTPTP